MTPEKTRLPRSLALGLLFAGSALAAGDFVDVPRDHWARPAIERAVEAGILEGYDGRFHGSKLVNRYQFATIVRRLLDTIEEDHRTLERTLAPRAPEIPTNRALLEQVAGLQLRLRLLEGERASREESRDRAEENLRALVRLHRSSPRKPW